MLCGSVDCRGAGKYKTEVRTRTVPVTTWRTVSEVVTERVPVVTCVQVAQQVPVCVPVCAPH